MNFTTILACLELSAQIYNYNGTNIHPAYTIVKSFDNDLYKPKFYVAKNQNDYYIVIRGESSLKDIQTLIDYMPVNLSSEFIQNQPEYQSRKYLVSSSILESATYVVNTVHHLIINSTGKIYFTGHSYGASIAAVASTIIRLNHSTSFINETENKYYLRTYAICFGSYPCLSPSLARITRKFITTFVVNNDVFASMNPKNIDSVLDSIVQRGSDKAKAGAARVALIFAKVVKYFNETNDNINLADEKNKVDLAKVSLEMTLSLIKVAPKAASIRMVNPGIVYHVSNSLRSHVPTKPLDLFKQYFKGKPKSEITVDETHKIQIAEFDETIEYGNLLDVLQGFADHYITSYIKVIKQSEHTKYPYYN